jgi:rod shape-determining protein MreC
VTKPLRQIGQRFGLALLLIASLAVIVVGRADAPLVERIRVRVADVMEPFLSALARPVALVTDASTRLAGALDLYRENDRLVHERETLLEWQQVARRLETENGELRALLKYQPTAAPWTATARVIGTSGGAYSRSVLVDRGSLDGVAKGQAAASGTGLVGRVTEVGERSARILLVTDLNSRIPVVVEPQHERAILAGDNSERASLQYLPPHVKVSPGDRIVTSGDGGVFPPGVAVGIVSSVEGSTIRVEPGTDLDRIEYLRLIDFGLSGVLPESALPGPKAHTPKAGRQTAAQP